MTKIARLRTAPTVATFIDPAIVAFAAWRKADDEMTAASAALDEADRKSSDYSTLEKRDEAAAAAALQADEALYSAEATTIAGAVCKLRAFAEIHAVGREERRLLDGVIADFDHLIGAGASEPQRILHAPARGDARPPAAH